MDLVPVLSCDNNSKKYDGKIWWEDFSGIVEVNGKLVTEHLTSASLRNGDTVLAKFRSKSKKLFKGVVELQPECDKDKVPTPTTSSLQPECGKDKVPTPTSSSIEEDTTISSKRPQISPPVRKIKGKSASKG